MKLTVAGLKGGPGKTTAAVFLSLGLARHRTAVRRDAGRVLLVDADPLSQSTLDWYTLAGQDWPATVEVIPWSTRNLAQRVAETRDHVVFDTGGEGPDILAAALMMSDEMLVPCGPSPAELRRVPATFETAARVDQVHPIGARVLLTKVRAGTRAGTEARALFEERGVPVMAAQVSFWQHYAEAYGTVPADLAEFGGVLDELYPARAVRAA